MGSLSTQIRPVCASYTLTIVATLALFAWGSSGSLPWAWLAVPGVLWTLVEWRGEGWLWGGRLGLVAGAITLALPMSLLRPCCRPWMAMTRDCCANPAHCAVAGAAVGLSLAMFLVQRPSGTRATAAGGMALGIVAVSVLKCPALFAGEAMGLLGGLLAGVAVATAITAAWSRRAVSEW